MKEISMPTARKIQVGDITDAVQKAVKKDAKAVLVFCPHTTCGLVLNEAEDDLAADFEALTKEYYGRSWRHDAHDGNAAAHLASSLFGHSVIMPVENALLKLGTWQRVLLLEGDGPRQRHVWIQKI